MSRPFKQLSVEPSKTNQQYNILDYQRQPSLPPIKAKRSQSLAHSSLQNTAKPFHSFEKHLSFGNATKSDNVWAVRPLQSYNYYISPSLKCSSNIGSTNVSYESMCPATNEHFNHNTRHRNSIKLHLENDDFKKPTSTYETDYTRNFFKPPAFKPSSFYRGLSERNFDRSASMPSSHYTGLYKNNNLRDSWTRTYSNNDFNYDVYLGNEYKPLSSYGVSSTNSLYNPDEYLYNNSNNCYTNIYDHKTYNMEKYNIKPSFSSFSSDNTLPMSYHKNSYSKTPKISNYSNGINFEVNYYNNYAMDLYRNHNYSYNYDKPLKQLNYDYSPLRFVSNARMILK